MRTILYATALASMLGSSMVAAAQLNPAIGPPDPKQYEAIDDPRNWLNPNISVEADSVEVRTKGSVNGKQIKIEELRQFLIELPLDSWPYGRVVIQSDQHIIPASRQYGRVQVEPDPIAEDYLRRMRQTRIRVERILKELGITAELWP